MTFLHKLHQALLKAETLLLLSLLISLIVIAVIQVLMRNVFEGGLIWADAYTRISVLWIAMVGAMIASRQRNHIAIDILMRRVPIRWKQKIQRVTDAVTGLICFVTAWFSFDFVLQEYDFGGVAFADIPTWWCETIIPIAFAVIAIRYSIAAFLKRESSGLNQ
ncbi:TRAP transporter small permease [Methylomonas sp. MgM2]